MLLPFVHARASVIVASVVVLCCYCCCENSNQTIPLKLIKTFNTSPCLFSLYCFIELLNLLPLLFRSVVVVWCFTLESKFCVYRETSARDANFLFFLNLLHRNVRFVLIFYPFCFSFGGFLSLSLSLKVPLLMCVCEFWIRSPNTTVFFCFVS